MHAILFALLGRAVLIERVKLHDAARQVGVGSRFSISKPKPVPLIQSTRLSSPGPSSFSSPVFGSRPFAEHIAHGARDALPDFEAGDHGGLIAPCRCSSSAPSAGSAWSAGCRHFRRVAVDLGKGFRAVFLGVLRRLKLAAKGANLGVARRIGVDHPKMRPARLAAHGSPGFGGNLPASVMVSVQVKCSSHHAASVAVRLGR